MIYKNRFLAHSGWSGYYARSSFLYTLELGCPAGFSYSSALSTCVACTSGTTPAMNMNSTCTACNSSQIVLPPGSNLCRPCPFGRIGTTCFPNAGPKTWTYWGNMPTPGREYPIVWQDYRNQVMYSLGGRVGYNAYSATAFDGKFWMLDLRAPSTGYWALLGNYPLNGNYSANAGDAGTADLHPGARFGGGAVVDYMTVPGDTLLWLFGGVAYGANGSTSGPHNDLWYYSVNAGTWRFVAGSKTINGTGPPARSHMAMWQSADSSSLVIWGGLSSGQIPVQQTSFPCTFSNIAILLFCFQLTRKTCSCFNGDRHVAIHYCISTVDRIVPQQQPNCASKFIVLVRLGPILHFWRDQMGWRFCLLEPYVPKNRHIVSYTSNSNLSFLRRELLFVGYQLLDLGKEF
jgi:hypothetical protein